MLVPEKKRFEIPDFTFTCGATLPVQLGYETYGTLSPSKDNVILIPHYFSANSHCAGKYHPEDLLPGYWDALIGPGKAVDTDKYFVISTDNLANCGAKNPMVYTTGPSTVDPKTGKPYGLRFPLPSILDMVHTQKRLLDHLGIPHLKAIMGASMGGMITYEWAVNYPEFMDKIIPVISNVKGPTHTAFSVCQHGIRAIALDPAWNGGDYYGGPDPKEGLLLAMQIMHVDAFAPAYFERTFRWDQYNPDCVTAPMATEAFEDQLAEMVKTNATFVDANHWLYTSKICMNHDISRGFGGDMDAALKKIRAKVLAIPSRSDRLHPWEFNQSTVERINTLGGHAALFVIESDIGHFAGILQGNLFAARLKDFLEDA